MRRSRPRPKVDFERPAADDARACSRRARALLALAARRAGASRGAHPRFVSDVAGPPDASLDVTETIASVPRTSHQPRHLPRFPDPLQGRRGGAGAGRLRAVEGVTRDGLPEPAAIEAISNGVRIRIGRPDVIIPPGEHRYVIRYRTTRQIGRFAEYDELYWNVTGNGWTFPIDQAGGDIRLPQPVQFGQRAVYTGAQGATGIAAEVIEETARRDPLRNDRAARPLRRADGRGRLAQGSRR